jgi:putative transposase
VVAKRHGVSEQAIYGWRKKFGAFQANDVRRLKHDLPSFFGPALT